MNFAKFLAGLIIVILSAPAFAQKTKVDPDILPALPAGPPKAASKSLVAKYSNELKGACVVALKKEEGLVPEVKIKNKGKINSICECFSREVAKGSNLEEIDFLTTFYKGFDNKMNDDEANGIYLHEGQKLEENCRLDSNYKVGQPEPRERQINSVDEKASAKKSK